MPSRHDPATGPVLIRSGALVRRVLDRDTCDVVSDGALIVKDGIIAETGTFDTLSARYRNVDVIGTGDHVMLPGFINAHHHIGLTPTQLGAPDLPLELWVVARMAARNVDPYLDTLYSAFEMIASGTTTVQHIHDAVPGTPAEIKGRLDAVARAYDDIGMRASICYGFDDQNRFAQIPDAQFLAGLPQPLRESVARILSSIGVGINESVAIFRALHQEHQTSRRIRFQLAPANLHWCSDEALAALGEAAQTYDVPLHMHLLETPYQRAYIDQNYSAGLFDHLSRFGLDGPHMTIGHAVWFNDDDIGRAVDSGVSICHNCSSNMRLRSGRASLMTLEKAGLNIAIGIDEAGINDDRDMLQEMRLVLNSHRMPGANDDVPGVGQVLRMATTGGARTTGFGEQVGTLEVGQMADLSLFNFKRISFPYLDPDVPIVDAVLRRAKSADLDMVMCDGNVIYRDGVFTRMDRNAILSELQQVMAVSLDSADHERKDIARALLPYVRRALPPIGQ